MVNDEFTSFSVQAGVHVVRAEPGSNWVQPAAAAEAAVPNLEAPEVVSQAEQDQIAAAIAASLALSQAPAAAPPASAPAAPRVKRWGEGLDAPAAGARHFHPPGFEVTLEVSEAIAQFGHSAAQVSQIMEAGRAKAATAVVPLAAVHAAALFAYTQEEPVSLYSPLNYAMRTPHSPGTLTDTELQRYDDYIVHTARRGAYRCCYYCRT